MNAEQKARELLNLADEMDCEEIYDPRIVVQWAESLRAIARALSGSEWRPIEEAPRDGTLVLLAFDYHPPRPGFWSGSDWVAWCPTTEGIDEPTHWQPLPAAPKPEGSGHGVYSKPGEHPEGREWESLCLAAREQRDANAAVLQEIREIVGLGSIPGDVVKAVRELREQPEARVGGEVVAYRVQHEDGGSHLIEAGTMDSAFHAALLANGRKVRPLVYGDTTPPAKVPEGMVRVEVAVVSDLMDALHSFAATAEDDECYTVSSELMSRLAMLGAVYRAKREGWYYLTDFGRTLLAAAQQPKEGCDG